MEAWGLRGSGTGLESCDAWLPTGGPAGSEGMAAGSTMACDTTAAGARAKVTHLLQELCVVLLRNKKQGKAQKYGRF